MIERIRGRVGERGDDWVTVDMGAVSVRVSTTRSTLSETGDRGSDVSLLTYLYVRDDVLALYGFSSREERALFERLLGITGIGPRAAQAILSAMTTVAVRDAIESENVDALVRVPGIGRKTAQRVILELKGKLVPLGPSAAVATPADGELIGLLVSLGYSAAEASEALSRVPAKEGLSDEDRLRAALRQISAR
jgi:Holliday junction DNA helicase RuvA